MRKNNQDQGNLLVNKLNVSGDITSNGKQVMLQSKKYRIVNYDWGEGGDKSWLYMKSDSNKWPYYAVDFRYHKNTQGQDASKYSFEPES